MLKENPFNVLFKGLSYVPPVLKMVGIILWLSVRDKADLVKLLQLEDGSLRLIYTPAGYGEMEMVPPPRHLYLEIEELFVRLKELQSLSASFDFFIEEADGLRQCGCRISCKDIHGDLQADLKGLLFSLSLEEEAQRAADAISLRQRKMFRFLAWSLLILGVVGACVVTLLLFFLLPG